MSDKYLRGATAGWAFGALVGASLQMLIGQHDAALVNAVLCLAGVSAWRETRRGGTDV